MKKMLIRQLRVLDDFFYDRIGPIRILFIIRNNFGLATLRPVIEKLLLNEQCKIAVTVEFEGCIDETCFSECSWFRAHYISPERAVYKKWHYAFSSDYSYLYFRRNVVLIYLQHGNGFGALDVSCGAAHEKKDQYQGLLNGDRPLLICANSKAMYDFICQKTPVSKVSSQKVVVTGRPRTDLYFNVDKIEKTKFLEKHSLNPSKKTIVVGSHFREKSLFSALGLPFIETLCEQHRDCNVIFMGHGRLWDAVDGGKNNKETYEALEALDRNNTNFKFLPKLLDTEQLVISGDLFVIDNSSFFIECCIADKPIIFFDHPDFVFGEKEVGEMYKAAAFCFSETTKISSVIDSAFENPAIHASHRKEVVDFFLANQGNATEFVVSLIEQIGRVSRPGTRQWKRLEQVCQASLSHL